MRILMPLPDRDFDVTEVAVPWHVLTSAGHDVVVSTQRRGTVPAADPKLLDGVLFGRLGAREEPKRLYHRMVADPRFRGGAAWEDLVAADYDGLLLAGGHATGMRQYLGSRVLQSKVADFWRLGRPVGAICHGPLVLARAQDPATGRSVLHGRRTTCLPKYLERSAHLLTAWRLGRYYRTYPLHVEDEIRAALATPSDFRRGPRVLSRRDTADDPGPAFVVRDGNYLSARWPGDAHHFAGSFLALLEESSAA
ncbi:type 1 glutamine amidotransferase domain-containing protein [Streptomyces fuscigenes]|uniref:type 1 glutamine amidotransferase domain-containing protein n=1 Tax=Streptomyces fuscigenes TaxID=1528880 RepID=UPI001F2C42C4|nr:type 1 glutamine amidotransferase domain-containing protein [Streptomyces fuscigenes]MCF3960875.1 type 1 glutamine amidotransferase domain-containing protein [Streptomyces fuscigenes]